MVRNRDGGVSMCCGASEDNVNGWGVENNYFGGKNWKKNIIFNWSKLTVTLPKLGEGGIQDSQSLYQYHCIWIPTVFWG